MTNFPLECVEILRWAAGANGVAKLSDGRVVFVPGALPGESWQILAMDVKKNFCHATEAKRLNDSAMRIAPACPHYGNCGGCDLQHLSYGDQLRYKADVVNDQFQRIGKITLPAWKVIAGEPWGYRRRIRLHRGDDQWGFLGMNSHSMVPVEGCPILASGLQPLLRKGAEPSSQPGAELRAYLTATGQVLLSPAHKAEEEHGFEKINHKQFSLDAQVFFQSNPDLVPRMVDWVCAQAGQGKVAIDLFSGVGLFAAFLADHFEKVYAVEREDRCLWHAKRHLPSNVEMNAEPAEDWWQRKAPRTDAIVVDPPRTGLPPSLLKALCARKASKLIYVSCDPATMARDCKDLVKAGYRIVAAQGFDLYPQSHHFEMALALEG